MKHHKIEQNTEEWFKLRCGKITASEFKTCFSSESTKGYKGLIYQKRAEIRTGEKEDSFKSEWMERGNELENEAKQAYESYMFQDVQNGGFYEYSEYIGASPDGLLNDDGLIEIKCPKASTMERYLEENRLPPEYKYQVHGQMLCSGRKYVEFVCYHPKYDLFIKRIERDEAIINEIKEKLDKILAKIINI